MMWVMIVDDEPKVLEHLSALLGDTADYQVCAQASNGDEALALLDEAQPDIIITDIRMPGMDGLQLLERIRSSGHVVGCVVLSGYGDFHYTQRAMSQGVKNYILKPVVEEELRGALAGAAQDVQQARRLARQIKKGVVARREHWLISKLYGYSRSEEDQETLDVGFTCGVLCLVAVLDSEAEEEETAWQSALTELHSAACIATVMGENRVACLCKQGDPVAMAVTLQQWFERRGKQTFVAYSLPISDFDTIVQHYRALCRLLDSRWLMQGMDILCEDALPQPRDGANWEELRNWDHDQLERAIRNCDREDIRRQVEQFFAALQAASLNPEMLRYFFTADIMHTMQLVLEHGGDAYQAVGGPLNLEALLRKSNVAQLQGWYIELCERIAVYLRHMDQERPACVSKQILAMFEADCAHNFTLRELAATFFMSEAYLGQIFKKEVGKTLHACLTEKRMEKAKRLLRGGDDPVYLVAESCGYPNLRNFYTVFKKYTGYTPNEYRQKG